MDKNMIILPTRLFIRAKEGTKEEFFDQFYDTKKFRRWFNVIPIVWITFDRDYLEEKCTGRITFMMPLFSYKFICKKIIPNKYIELEVSGLMRGTIRASFNQQSDGVLMEHPMELQGINIFVHLYFRLFLGANHEAFMNWRYKVLRNNLIKEKMK